MKRDRAVWRKYRRDAARAFKAAIARKHGTQGAASDVRRIDPATYQVPQPKPAHRGPPPEAAAVLQRALERKADRMLNQAKRRRVKEINA
jgi:hypothetical protein